MLKVLLKNTQKLCFIRHFSSFSSNDHQLDAKKLLENAATFIDSKPTTAEDAWSTLPYAQGAVIPKRRQADDPNKRPKIDPEETSLILFPGEGLQYGGMAKKLISCPAARDIFETANQILGYDLLKLCLEGPQSKLNMTVYGQPAVFTTSVAALSVMHESRPNAIENCVGTAGYSLGEITALVFAGALSFEQGLQLVEIRAEAMQIAYDRGDCGTANVKCRPASDLKKACEKAKQFCVNEKGIPEVECTISSYLFPSQRIVSGHNEALNFLAENKDKYGLLSVKKHRLPGANHSNLMQSAVQPFTEALESMDIRDPIIGVHSNVDGQQYKSAAHIRKRLPEQIVSPIKWEQTMHVIYSRRESTYPRTFTCGPDSGLMWLLKRNNAKAWDAAVKLSKL